eukprot:4450734-Prymnesium_polylepis.1
MGEQCSFTHFMLSFQVGHIVFPVGHTCLLVDALREQSHSVLGRALLECAPSANAIIGLREVVMERIVQRVRNR